MTNFEYWKDNILEIARSESSLALYQGKPAKCCDTICSQCGFEPKGKETCIGNILKWLYAEHIEAEHIEQPKLTAKERMFCKLFETGWIARDKNGSLFIFSYDDKPFKGNYSWISDYSKYRNLFNSPPKFSFIKWEDEEPWSVEDLLKLEVEE